jgi:two-component system, LuxR family, response regulator FixJ
MEHPPIVAVIDDDPATLMILEHVIQSGGLVPVCFEIPEEFLGYMSTNRPDCILLDMNMPGLSGTDVQCRLKEMGVTVPVIMVTGDSDLPTARAALHNGAVDFITKPIDSEELLLKIRETCQAA